jgi:hypothetical protein
VWSDVVHFHGYWITVCVPSRGERFRFSNNPLFPFSAVLVATSHLSLYHLNVTVQDLERFINASVVGDLLLKLLMCGLPPYQQGRGLTPFWQTNPYNACKCPSSVELAGSLFCCFSSIVSMAVKSKSNRTICPVTHVFCLCLYCVFSCDAGYGWQNDPMRVEIQKLLLVVQNKSANHTVVPWTNSVPGGAFNWTSIDETRRRRQNDVFKTGKKNPNQVW